MVKPIDTGADDAPVLDGQVGGPNVAAQMVSPAVAGAPYAELGNIGNQLSDLGTKLLEPEMADRGAQAVTRDPATGQLSVQLRTPLNDLDVAYNHAAQAAFVSQSEGDRRGALQQLAIDNMDDPQQFQTLATKYVKTQAGGAGVPTGLRGDLLTTGLSDVSQFTNNLVAQKQVRDTRTQLDAIHTGIQATQNDIFALAHDGGTQTPDFQAAVGKLQNQYAALRNPVFGVSDDQIKNELSDTLSSAEGEAALGHALQTAKAGGMQAGMDFLDKAIWDPSLNLTVEQRRTFQARGHSEIGEMEAQQRQAGTELKQQVSERLDDAASSAQMTGDWTSVVSPNEISRAFADDPAKASDIISRLNGLATTYSMKKQVALATPDDIAAMQARLDPSKNPQPSGGFDGFYQNFVAPHEGGYTASDGNGSPANFGVNQGANPGIDVKNLTQPEAKQILHDRYWVASGADALPPALGAVVGDTAINMGVGTAKDLLAQSGGDPQKYLDLRAQQYRAIAANDPTKAANLPTWLERNEDLRNYVTGGAFSDQARTYQAFQKAVIERNVALVKDPAAYIASARPDISTALQSTDPTQIQLGIRSSLQAQRDMGVLAPKILTDGQVSSIVQSFNNPPDPTKNADNMISIIGGLRQQYGDYFPQAMAELQKKGMPPEASALYQASGNAVASARLASAINSMSHLGKDLNAGRDAFFANAPNNNEIRKAIPGVMGDYAASLQGNPDGPAQINSMNYAVGLYARQLSYEGVDDPQKAAQQAHDDLIGSRYNYSSGNGFGDNYRIPRGIDPAIIQQGADAARASISPDNIEPYGNAAPGVSVDDRHRMSARILTTQGRWVTRSDDKGLYLVWPQLTGYRRAVDGKGKPISMSWAQLQAAGQSRARLVQQQRESTAQLSVMN